MSNDYFAIETDADDTEVKQKIGMAAMQVAVQRGYAEVSPGCILYDNKTMIANQKKLPANDTGKTIDFTAAPFWMVLQPEGTVSPIDDPLDVLDFMDTEPVRETA